MLIIVGRTEEGFEGSGRARRRREGVEEELEVANGVDLEESKYSLREKGDGLGVLVCRGGIEVDGVINLGRLSPRATGVVPLLDEGELTRGRLARRAVKKLK